MHNQMQRIGILLTRLRHVAFVPQPHRVTFAAAACFWVIGGDDALSAAYRRAIAPAHLAVDLFVMLLPHLPQELHLR